MSATFETAVPESKNYPLGVSRPALGVDDLPTPEEVFKAPRIGVKEAVAKVIGPSLIALGLSIGSGEWLLGPLNVGQYGFVGIGWVILVSAVLQTFYNVEIARYTLATGEVPALGFSRVPPGLWLWLPVSLLAFYIAFIWGGWAASAGSSLFALVNGRVPAAADLPTVRLLGVALMGVVFLITLFGQKIERTLELVSWILVGFVLISMLILDILIVPINMWGEAIAGLLTPALPPAGTDARLLGGLAGFTAMASGLNWIFMNYYRDKGYGMGSKVGYIAGLIGGEQERVLATGKTFPQDERNGRLWKRWYRFLLLDMWVVFFVGAILGMLLPAMLMSHLVALTGTAPTDATIPTFAAEVLGRFYSPALFYWALIMGFLILFSTQMTIFEMLVRNVVDSLYGTSARFRNLIHGDPRRFYYPYMIVLAVVIAALIHTALPAGLILISANMSNLGALIFPFLLIFLNSRLPRPARTSWWGYVILILNVVFFGFFFVNFAWQQLTGSALVTF